MPAPQCLILPYLDREFQTLAHITSATIDRFSRSALIACPTVIASPDFFVESTKVRGSIITADEFYGTPHVRLSMRDATLQEYWRRKQLVYGSVRNHYSGYFDSLEKYLYGLHFPVRRREFEIVDRIKSLWMAASQSEGRFSFLHMALEISDKAERDNILSVMRSVPSEVRGGPFVWERVRQVMDKETPTWGNTNLKPALRSFLLKSYFEALCEEGDALVAFSDFRILGIADSSLSKPTIPLMPINQFLAASQVLNVVLGMPAVKFLEVIASPECEAFRREYNNFVRIVETPCRMEQNDPEESSYQDAVETSNNQAHWIVRILRKAGQALSGAKKVSEVRPLLERAAARGFVQYIKRVGDQPEFLREINAKHPVQMTIGQTNMFLMRKNIIIGQAAAVGDVAIAVGNTLHQEESRIEVGTDIKALKLDLEKLRSAMRKAAETPEHDVALGHVANAQIECERGNLSGALECLKGAGKWAFKLATAIGAETVSAALKKLVGLGT